MDRIGAGRASPLAAINLEIGPSEASTMGFRTKPTLRKIKLEVTSNKIDINNKVS